MTLRYELEPFASTGREAALILDELFNNIIAALRRDRRPGALPRSGSKNLN